MVIIKKFSKNLLVFVATVSCWGVALNAAQPQDAAANFEALSRQAALLQPTNMRSHVGTRGLFAGAVCAGGVAAWMVHKDYYSPSEIVKAAGIAGLTGCAAGAAFGWWDYSKIQRLYALNQQVINATASRCAKMEQMIQNNQDVIRAQLGQLNGRVASLQEAGEQHQVTLTTFQQEQSAATGRIEAQQNHQTQILETQARVLQKLDSLLDSIPHALDGNSVPRSATRALPAPVATGNISSQREELRAALPVRPSVQVSQPSAAARTRFGSGFVGGRFGLFPQPAGPAYTENNWEEVD